MGEDMINSTGSSLSWEEIFYIVSALFIVDIRAREDLENFNKIIYFIRILMREVLNSRLTRITALTYVSFRYIYADSTLKTAKILSRTEVNHLYFPIQIIGDTKLAFAK